MSNLTLSSSDMTVNSDKGPEEYGKYSVVGLEYFNRMYGQRQHL